MPNSATAEMYFIAAMMFLILIICAAAVYFFFRQYNLEKRKNVKTAKKPQPEKEFVEK